MGKSQRNKGYRGEYKLVKLLEANGLKAIRVPLSGGASIKGDIIINDKYRAEVKWRKNGFKELYRWLDGNDILFIKADRHEYLAVMEFEDFIKLIKGELK